jgi:chemotaxis protein MotB
MARKKQEDEVQEGAAWMTTYADMVTLLFTFFVLMFAISSVDQGKFQMFFAAMQPGGLTDEKFMAIQIEHGMIDLGDTIADPENLPKPPPYDNVNLLETDAEDGENQDEEDLTHLEMLYQQLKDYLFENDMHEHIYLHPGDGQGNMLLMTLTSDVFFDSGSAVVLPPMRDVAVAFAGLLRSNYEESNPFRVVVSGHTDNVPQTTYPFSSNWHLSVFRATNFIEILIRESGIPSNQFVIQGHGEEMPIASNDTPEGRRLNRRVEIIISQERLQRPIQEYDPPEPEITEPVIIPANPWHR